ncbi:MAG: response regulator [Candidatus Anammoxibacter sp.]
MSTSNFSNNCFEDIFKAIPDSLIITNAKSLIKMVNPAVLELLGYKEGEIVGKPLETLFVKDERTSVDSLINDFVKSDVIRNVQRVFRTKDDKEIPALISLSKIRDNDHIDDKIVCIVRDITAIKKDEEELKNAKEKAEETTRVKSDYLAKMSHEIRTNMNAVIGMTSLLSEADELNKDHKLYVKTVRDSAIWLVTLVTDILDFSKIEAGKLEIKKIDFDLRTMIEGVSMLFAHNAEEKGIELACLVRSNLPVMVRSDPWRLRQILINLVSNAIEHTEKGEVLIQSTLVDETDTHAKVRFVVSDTGLGISKSEIGNLFKPFSQADALISRKQSGTGLGLTISKQICELMGGEIGVDSEQGRGAKFWFTISLEKQKNVNPVVPLSSEQVSGLSVLIIADKDVNFKVLSHHLSSWGCRYGSVVSGTEAVDKLRKSVGTPSEYQLVLVDYQTTDISVEKLAQTIKDDPLLRSVRLILMTSLAKRGDANRVHEAGFSAFLTKPIKKDQLFDCIAAVMGFQYSASVEEKPDLITRHSLMEQVQRNRALILLVEDNIVNQTLAVSILEKAGYHVDIACDGLEAVKAVKAHFYDAVLMDCEMPKMDGYEATKEIRQMDGFAKYVPIIAVTATFIKPGDRENCLKIGMNDYLAKPYKPKELLDLVSKWLDDEPVFEDIPLPQVEGEDSGNEVFSKTAALIYVDSDIDLLKKLVRQFLDDYPGKLSKIKDAIRNNDSKAIKHAAHAIKGSVGNLYARTTFSAASRLEKMVHDGNASEIDEAYNLLEKEIGRLKQEVVTFLEGEE